MRGKELLLIVGVLVGGCRCLPQPGCSEENCRLALECRQQPVGTPWLSTCVRSGLSPPEGWPAYSQGLGAERCCDACRATGSGRIMSCVADLAPQCRELTSSAANPHPWPALVEQECQGHGGSEVIDRELEERCWNTLRSCEGDCPTDSWDACEECSAHCGLEYASCIDH